MFVCSTSILTEEFVNGSLFFRKPILHHYTDLTIQRRLGNKICLYQGKQMIEEVMSRVVNERYLECLEYLLTKMKTHGKAV